MYSMRFKTAPVLFQTPSFSCETRLASVEVKSMPVETRNVAVRTRLMTLEVKSVPVETASFSIGTR